jgi:hypothetical protein
MDLNSVYVRELHLDSCFSISAENKSHTYTKANNAVGKTMDA